MATVLETPYMMGKYYYRKLVEADIRQAAYKHDIKIKEINVQPEYVHLVAELPKYMNNTKSSTFSGAILRGRFFRQNQNSG